MTSIASDTSGDIKKKFNTFKDNWFHTIRSGICDKNFDKEEIVDFIQNWEDKAYIKNWLIEQLNELEEWKDIKDDIINSEDLKEDFKKFRNDYYNIILKHLTYFKTDNYLKVKQAKKGIASDNCPFLTIEVASKYKSKKGGKRRKKKTRRKPIRINPKMRGVFTKKAKRKGMSVQKYAKYIVKKYKGKKKTKRQLKLFRQALFAKTAKKWKKKKRRKKNRRTRKKGGGKYDIGAIWEPKHEVQPYFKTRIRIITWYNFDDGTLIPQELEGKIVTEIQSETEKGWILLGIIQKNTSDGEIVQTRKMVWSKADLNLKGIFIGFQKVNEEEIWRRNTKADPGLEYAIISHIQMIGARYRIHFRYSTEPKAPWSDIILTSWEEDFLEEYDKYPEDSMPDETTPPYSSDEQGGGKRRKKKTRKKRIK